MREWPILRTSPTASRAPRSRESTKQSMAGVIILWAGRSSSLKNPSARNLSTSFRTPSSPPMSMSISSSSADIPSSPSRSASAPSALVKKPETNMTARLAGETATWKK